MRNDTTDEGMMMENGIGLKGWAIVLGGSLVGTVALMGTVITMGLMMR